MRKRNPKKVKVNIYCSTDNKNTKTPKKVLEIFAKKILEEYRKELNTKSTLE